MDNFANYLKAQANREAAYQQYNYAGQKLENAYIHERLAEIKSQHEPIASLLNKSLSDRGRLHAIAYYVVVGRMPEPHA